MLQLLDEPAARYRATTTLTHTSADGGDEYRYLRSFWTAHHRHPIPAQQLHVAPVASRLRQLLLRPFPRAVLTGHPLPATPPHPPNPRGPSNPTSPSSPSGPAGASARVDALDLTRVLDGGATCLARLPEGTLGADTTRLLGSLLVARTWHAATARAHQPEPERADAALYLDEAHQFLHMPYSLERLLAEARGYRLSLVLAHQQLAQLPGELIAALGTNAATKIFFRCPDDARHLERHVAPDMTAHDLANLDPYTAAARVRQHNTPTPAFTLTTPPPPPRPAPTFGPA